MKSSECSDNFDASISRISAFDRLDKALVEYPVFWPPMGEVAFALAQSKWPAARQRSLADVVSGRHVSKHLCIVHFLTKNHNFTP